MIIPNIVLKQINIFMFEISFKRKDALGWALYQDEGR